MHAVGSGSGHYDNKTSTISTTTTTTTSSNRPRSVTHSGELMMSAMMSMLNMADGADDAGGDGADDGGGGGADDAGGDGGGDDDGGGKSASGPSSSSSSPSSPSSSSSLLPSPSSSLLPLSIFEPGWGFDAEANAGAVGDNRTTHVTAVLVQAPPIVKETKWS